MDWEQEGLGDVGPSKGKYLLLLPQAVGGDGSVHFGLRYWQPLQIQLSCDREGSKKKTQILLTIATEEKDREKKQKKSSGAFEYITNPCASKMMISLHTPNPTSVLNEFIYLLT